MIYSPVIDRLIQALKGLPGVGNKTAQRMAFHLLEKSRSKATLLAQTLTEAVSKVGFCNSCHTLTEEPQCQICSNPKRNTHLLCIVESPSDVLAIEQSGCYNGLYFVLMGHLSPIDGIGPEDIGIPELNRKLATKHIQEVILATNSTVEGEATAYYISEIVKDHHITTTRIAHGIPLGGELEYTDTGTIIQALNHRSKI